MNDAGLNILGSMREQVKKNKINYWNLSYKEKFKRTIWMIPISAFLIIQMFIIDFPLRITYFFSMALILVGGSQLIYTYRKWKKEQGA